MYLHFTTKIIYKCSDYIGSNDICNKNCGVIVGEKLQNYLGLWLDRVLNWKIPIEKLYQKLNTVLFFEKYIVFPLTLGIGWVALLKKLNGSNTIDGTNRSFETLLTRKKNLNWTVKLKEANLINVKLPFKFSKPLSNFQCTNSYISFINKTFLVFNGFIEGLEGKLVLIM